MKTYNHLWPQIASLEQLLAAYHKARKGHIDSTQHLRFAADLTGNLLNLQRSLRSKAYRTGPYHLFTILHPKQRSVAALPFKDRVAQHSLCMSIEPIFDARFIHDSYACRTGRGTHYGIERVQGMIRSCQAKHGVAYALKGDISSYFASINHEILIRILEARITCVDTRWLLREIIASSPGEGLPIGNLTSQLFANVYLDQLDQYAKTQLRTRWYARYADDWLIIHHDPAYLHELRRHLQEWIPATLGLQVNPKTHVQRVEDTISNRLDWLGYRIGPHKRTLRKATRRRWSRAKRAHRRGRLQGNPEAVMASFEGLLKFERPQRK